jgi:hypothetical protein
MVAMKEPAQTMNHLQTWIEELNPLASLPSIAILFLIAIIAGWYCARERVVEMLS